MISANVGIISQDIKAGTLKSYPYGFIHFVFVGPEHKKAVLTSMEQRS